MFMGNILPFKSIYVDMCLQYILNGIVIILSHVFFLIFNLAAMKFKTKWTFSFDDYLILI